MATTTTTSGGTVTSLSNTPQAQDDIFTTGVIGTSTTAITEDLLGVVYLDVMSNDLGGSAKTLWSLDDATSLSTATKVYAPADLLIQDTGRIEATSTDTSSNGAKIWITSDGKVGYDAATLSTAFKAQLQSLAGGGSLTDTFTYAIRLGNGTLSWATAQVQFAGMNDSVTMSIGVQAGTVTEDATTTPSPTDSLSATGTIAFSDVDLSDTHTASFVAAGGNATALGNFTLASVTEAANAADGTINWTYTLDNAAAQSLAQGQTVTETYVVTISDGHGSSTTQNVTITITGTNDQVQITSGVQAGDAGEDSGDYAASGSITFTDVDLIDTHSVTVTPGASGYLGSFTTDPLSDSTGTGSGSLGWNFAVNNTALQFLGEGQSVTQTYNVAIGDGALQTVTITITGINDQVQITSGVQAGDAGEDSGNYAASGSITFADVDLIDTHSVSVTPGASGYLGSFTTDPLSDSTATGSGSLAWNFAVNNAALQFLGEGQSVTQTYNVAIGDGAVQTVTITITGINDQVQITSGVQAGDAGEDSGDYAASGSITFADVDLIDTHSVTVTPGASGYLGSFTTDPLSDSTGTGSGSLGWNFAVNNAALQFLGEGQSVTQTYNVAIGDGALQTVTITITGINDQVQITSGVQAGDAGEDSGDYAASGNITFTDVDLIETHSVSVTPGASGYLGSFTTNPLSDSTGTGSGSLGWNFAVNNTALQFLGEGQIVTQTYNVAIGDGAVQTVTITITGTNDQPTLTMADSTGAMSEGNGTATLSDSGALSFADLDSNDTVTVSQTANGDIAWSGGTLNAGVASALVAGFSVDQNSWDYSSNQNLDFLGAGETISFSYAVVATDDSGTANAASATQTVTITITGTNDQPTLTITDSTGAMSEGNGTATLSDSGALSFADLDSTDTVTVSQTANGDIAWSGGTLNASVASALVAGFSVDQNSWDYSSNQNLDFLGAGETITFSYAVVATDDSGTANAASATQTVTITITGTNDQPTLTITDSTGAMSEGNGTATLSDSGALSFADLDSNDTVTVSQTANGDIAWSGGVLNASVASALVAGFSVDQNSWDYSSNQNLDFLGAGETITFSYAVVATDDSGTANAASATQTVTITITGTNDQPTLTITDSTGAMSEGNGTATLSDSGALSFADLDSNDTVTVSQTANGDIAWSGGTLNAGVASALVAGFSVDQNSWDYSSNQNLDFLGAGETISFSYAVVATDDSGAANAASATQTVTITITGTNDQPTLTMADSTGAMNEGNGTATLSDSGALSFADLDSTDTVTVSQTANGDIAWSGGTLNAGVASALVAGFSVDQNSWDYSSNQNLDFLGAGETISFSYAVVATDDSGAANAASAVQTVTITITGSNDAAVLSSANVTLTETNTPLSTSGTLTISDVDSAATFVAQANTAGSYGQFSIGTNGAWSYIADSAHNEFVAGTTYTDTFAVSSADGTVTSVTVHILGTNDAALLSADIANLTETNTPLSTSGTLTISDVDSAATFVAQANTAGSYGQFSIGTGGAWTYIADSAHNEFVAGTTYTDTFAVSSADGTVTSVTVHILGTNDAALLSADIANLTETNTPLSTSGTLTISDVDSAATFVAQANTAGSYGQFSIGTGGAWTYIADSAHNEFVAGTTYTDTFAVSSADGTVTSVTVHILGTNDAALLSADIANLTETNTPLSTSGTLTISDVDSATTFVAQANTAGSYGQFSIGTGGAWSYIADSAHNEFAAGTTYTDTFAVSSADGTVTSVTVHILGSNDAAVLSSASVTLTETNAPLTTGATLTISDIDSPETFQAQSGTAGANGTFAINTAGNWSYTANSAFDSLNVGDSLSDTFTVLSADGTATAVTVTINGSNDSPTITFNGGGATASVNVAENTAAVTTVAATDVDLPAQTLSYSILNTAGTDFSKFSISSSGVLTFNSAPDYENAQDVGGADGDNAYVVDVLVADGNGGTDTQTITVNVQNVVETPVDMTPPASPTGLTYNKTGGPNHKLSGSAEANSSIKVYLDNGNGVFGAGDTEIGTGTTNTGGQFANIDLDGKFTGTKTLFVTATDAAGNVSAATSISLTYPAGVSGEAINLAIADPSAGLSDSFVVTVTDVPSNWILNTGTNNGDGSWTVQTSDPGALTVTTPEGFTGAAVLHINMTWTNADGSVGSSYVFNNVEAFAPGAPIFALSADDNLTGSSGADTFVFAQPIGNNQIYSFDVTADKIDLIGFTGITSFADLNITNDANGNALVSIGSGQSVTLKGVDAADLSEANFQFDVDPVMTNTGTLTIADGAIMPFGGSIQNSGTIELGSTGSETELEILFRGATLTGGGQVLLSDSAQNVIFGGSADTVLTNADNRISGAGQLGAGQMVLVNAGLILASGLNSLVLDTGSHTITNSGVLESTGEGGMTVASAVDNSGHLWANGGDMRLLADVIGNGSATIDGDATLSFDGAVHGSVAFHGEGAGTLVIAQAEAASSLVGILGLESDDMLTFGDLAFGANTQLSYSANASGAGGLLTVDDGVHRAEVNLLGHYTVEDFQVTGGETGTQVSYNGASSGTLVGSMAADVLSGSDGNDILAGRGGEDTLSGGAGADVFAYLNEAEGGDTILDYNFAEGDSLDLSALLSANFVSGISQASDFVQLAQSGSNITVQVDADGAANGTNFADVAVLANTGTSGTDLVRTWFGETDHTLTA
ncbi:VCBS domain-containing protein [Pseudomonas lini]